MPLTPSQEERELEYRKARMEAAERQRFEEEKRAKELAEQKAQLEAQQVNLSPEDIGSYKKLLSRNLQDREDAKEYLMGLLFKKMPDPTDPLADMIIERTPQMMAKEMKYQDRQGKSKIGNFFRDFDYAMGDIGKRDRTAAQQRQTEALRSLDNILKDQGSEIQRSLGLQQLLANKTADRGLQTTKAVADMAARGRQQGQKELLDESDMARKNALAQSTVGLNEQRGKLIGAQTALTQQQADNFMPYNIGQPNSWALFLDRMSKTDPERAKALQKLGIQNQMSTEAAKAAFRPQGGTTSSTTRPNGHWDKDPNGNSVYNVDGTITSTTTRGGGKPAVDPMEMLNKALGLDIEVPQAGKAEATAGTVGANKAAVKALQKVAQGAAPSQVAPKAVRGALEKVKDAAARETMAVDAIKYNLTPEQIQNDELRRSTGRQYVLDVNPKIKWGKPGTGGPKAKEEAEKFQTANQNITVATEALMKAASTGLLEKAFNSADTLPGKLMGAAKAVVPSKLQGWVLPGDNPDYDLKRIFPNIGNMSNEEVSQLRTMWQSFNTAIAFSQQKSDTGLQATNPEMDRILTQLPRSTDSPKIALQIMLTYAVRSKVNKYLSSLGYQDGATQEEISRQVGDYVTPKVKEIVSKIFDAKAMAANRKLARPEDVIKDITLKDLDPAEIIGASLDARKANFDLLPIRVRRLGPKKSEEPSGSSLNFLNTLDEYNLPSRSKK